jgi:hypothetical protein
LRNIFSTPDTSTIGLLVKNIELPKFKLDTEVLNQYNRKRVVQKRIDYDPISIKFHDDSGDLIRTMWYNYYSYYYKDPSQPYRGQTNTNGSIGQSATLPNGFDYNNRDIYSSDRFVNDWGYVGESYYDGTSSTSGKPPFFKDISIYGMNQHKFVEYVLINPLISDWSHDTYDYSQDAGVRLKNRFIDPENHSQIKANMTLSSDYNDQMNFYKNYLFCEMLCERQQVSWLYSATRIAFFKHIQHLINPKQLVSQCLGDLKSKYQDEPSIGLGRDLVHPGIAPHKEVADDFFEHFKRLYADKFGIY